MRTLRTGHLGPLTPGRARPGGAFGLARIGVALLLSAPLALAQIPRAGDPDRRCLDCHGQPHIAELGPAERAAMVGTWLGPVSGPPPEAPVGRPAPVGDEPATRPGLYVTRDAFRHSVHPDVHCIDCHEDAARLPHAPRLELNACATECHEEEARGFAAGAHAEALLRGEEEVPTCTSCHGGHDIIATSARDAPAHHLNSLFLCGDCHSKHRDTPGGHESGPFVGAYRSSAHGLAITQRGLVGAATCVDCHGAHEVHPSRDPRSPVHRRQTPETCGRCHLGILETYEVSVHGHLLASEDERVPVCSDCHTSHGITRTSDSAFMLDVVDECGECHDDPELSGARKGTYYQTYRLSYHGQVNELGSTRVARCSDCHGAHDIAPLDDPASRVAPGNLMATCGQAGCHPGANEKFVQFDPHANYRDGSRYPLLHAVWIYFIVVMSGAFGFFGLHSLLWFIRSLIERARHGKPPNHRGRRPLVRRFTRLDRVNHVFVAVTFLGLTATGIPLSFSDERWSAGLAFLFGGIERAGVWHRFFAFLLIVNLIVHFGGVAVRAARRRGTFRQWLFGPTSMMPRWKDVRDCAGMFRWFFRGGQKPRFDRWTYWEKFDYWCELAGSVIIGGSGLLLWFPMAMSTVLPGWSFNVAMIVHGYEALLAIGFIFTIHFFNANLRLDKFPVDEVIFSGRLPEAELAEERPLEYERIAQTGELDEIRVPPWPEWKSHLAVGLGIIAMVIGITLVILIIVAGLLPDLSGVGPAPAGS